MFPLSYCGTGSGITYCLGRFVSSLAESSLSRLFERRPNLPIDHGSACLVEFFPAFFKLGARRGGVRLILSAKAQPGRIDGKIDVLGESLDDTEYFGQGCAAFEDEFIGN